MALTKIELARLLLEAKDEGYRGGYSDGYSRGVGEGARVGAAHVGAALKSTAVVDMQPLAQKIDQLRRGVDSEINAPPRQR